MIRRVRKLVLPTEKGPDASEALKGKVRRLRRRVERLEASNATLVDRWQRQSRELDALRATTLDVFPSVTTPPEVQRVKDAVRAEELTFLDARQLDSLVACVLETEASGRPGLLIEAGTARGGSAIAMAAAKAPGRPMRVYDVFGMIPPPTERDGEDVQLRYQDIADGKAAGRGDEIYYGYRDDLEGEVRDSFARHGVPVEQHHVQLVKGLFEDTMVIDEPVALAHVDGDWYSSTMTCLRAIAPQLVAGGRIVIDDYYTWSGCRTAVDEYFAGRAEFRIEMRAKVHVVRIGG